MVSINACAVSVLIIVAYGISITLGSILRGISITLGSILRGISITLGSIFNINE